MLVNVKDFLLNPLHLKNFAVLPLFMVFTTLPQKIKLFSLFLLMSWLAFYLLHDLFTERNFTKTRFSLIFLAFVVCASFSIVLNIFRYGWDRDAIDPLMVFALFFFLAIVPNSVENRDQIYKDLYSFNWAVTLVSIVPFFLGAIFYIFSFAVWVPGLASKLIFINERAVNLYWANRYFIFIGNPNEGSYLTILAATAAIINLYLLHKGKEKSPVKKTIYWVSLVSAFICFIAFASRTGFVVVCVGLAVALFLFGLQSGRLFNYYLKTNISRVVSALITATCGAGMAFLLITISTLGLAWFTSYTRYYQHMPDLPGAKTLVEFKDYTAIEHTPETDKNITVTMQREYVVEENLTAGRAEIWQTYLRMYKYSPVLGFSPAHAPEIFKLYAQTYPEDSKTMESMIIGNHGNGAMNTHNMYLYVLSFYGILGFLSFMVFILVAGWYFLKYFLLHFKERSDSTIVLMMLSLIVGSLFWALMGDILITRLCPYSFAVWIYLGYLLHPKLYDDGKFDWSIKSVFNSLLQRAGCKIRV